MRILVVCVMLSFLRTHSMDSSTNSTNAVDDAVMSVAGRQVCFIPQNDCVMEANPACSALDADCSVQTVDIVTFAHVEHANELESVDFKFFPIIHYMYGLLCETGIADKLLAACDKRVPGFEAQYGAWLAKTGNIKPIPRSRK